jgi:hypothetical protein
MITGNKVTPTSTVLQARVMIYQPSQRPKEFEGQWMETSAIPSYELELVRPGG